MANGAAWTEERVKELTDLWGARDSNGGWLYPLREIAQRMRIGKNAIIGKAHRLDLETRVPSRKQPKPRLHKARPKSVSPTVVVRISSKEAAVKHPPSPDQLVLPDTLSIPLLKLQADQCRSVLDERGADGLALFCGAPCESGPYCEYHHSIYYEPPRGNGGQNGWRTRASNYTNASYTQKVNVPIQRSEGRGDQPPPSPAPRKPPGNPGFDTPSAA